MASHRSAAYLLGMPGRSASDPVDVIVPDRRSPQLQGVRIHRPTDLDHLTPTRVANIRCTNVLRTLCDLGAVDPRGVLDSVGHALTNRLATLAALEATLLDHARSGRHGVTALRAALDEFTIDAKPADSVLEQAMARLVRRFGLPPVDFHPELAGWEVDFRVRGSCVVLECDGWAYHGLRRSTFERDRRRDAELAALGWVVVRFTYRAVTRAPRATARRICAAVDRWQHAPPPDTTSLEASRPDS